MTEAEASTIVIAYHKTGLLPEGFTADHSTPTTTLQGDEYEVVQIMQNNAVKISYVVKNEEPTDIAVL